MKLVFIFDYPVSERDAARCGFDRLRMRGYEVEAWDITGYVHPQVAREVRVPDPLQSTTLRRFTSSRETAAALSALPPATFLFLFVYYQLGAVALYRTIGKRQIPYAVMVTNALPRPAATAATREPFVKRVARLTPRKLAWHGVARIPKQWLAVPSPAFVVAGGEESLASQEGFYPVSTATPVVWAHSPDYDHYLKEQAIPREADERQAVFLDEYLPFHPDYHYLRMNAPATAEDYYPKLRAYFEYLERDHGVRVVIAAHPRSEYEKHPDYFGGRAVVRGRTPELVRTSRFVIAHSSTSLNYAVMFERPVVFVTTSDIDATYLGRYGADLAARFVSPRINLDAPPVTWCAAGRVDRDAYARYRAAYIKKPGAPERFTWEIVADHLEQVTT